MVTSGPRTREPLDWGRIRLILMISGVLVLLVIVEWTWPPAEKDLRGDRVFEGEVWGDLTTEGEIWGECVSDLELVGLDRWSTGGGIGLRVNVTNLSNVWLYSYRHDFNVSVPCMNRSFLVIADNGSFIAYLSDLDIRCEYLEFSGTFPGDEEDYFPDYTVSSVEGRGTLVHGEYHRWDMSLDDCLVVIDGIEYRDVDSVFINESDHPLVTIRGDIGQQGNIRVGRILHPHVNGTVVVENLLLEEGGRSRLCDRVRFEGEDILIEHSGGSQYGTGGPFAWFDQWSIRVTLSGNATVDIDLAPSTPLWVEVVLIICIGVLLLAIFMTRPRKKTRQ